MMRIHNLGNAASLVGLLAAAVSLAAQPAADKLARPTPQQAAWHDSEIGMFICLDPCTWQDREYDNHSTPLERINPEKLDTDQWVSAAEGMGAKYIIFVAKHTGGFCWWQTETTDYGVRNIPWRGGRGDVMKDLAESCRKRGIKLGVYLSPADDQFGAGGGGRCKTPEAQERYDRIFRQQLTELLSRYGEMFEVWFDGSSITDVGDLLKQYCPNAMVFQGPYATIRWVGNEDGVAPYPNWNSVPLARAKSGVSTGADGHPDGDAWMPNECDARIRSTWFWNSHNAHTLKSVEQLMAMYYQSVGRGAVLLLNIAPDTTGLMPEADVRRAAEFGAEIRRRFGRSIAETSGQGDVVELDLGRPTRIDHVITMENILEGERVREYVIEGLVGGQWQELCRGSSIGHKKIDQFAPTEVSQVRLRVVKSAAEPLIRKLAVYDVGGASQAIGEKGAAGLAAKIWEWSPETVGTDWQTVDIDLTAVCKEACVYQVDFTPAAGKPPLEIQSLTLLMDGIALPEFTKPVGKSLRYDVTVTGLGKPLALRAVLRASGEQKHSQGTLTIRKKLAGPPVSRGEGGPMVDKTLVAWVYVAQTNQQGGSVLTLIDKAEHFDAIVLGEVAQGKWMAGSDYFRRTQQDQASWPLETAGSNTLVQFAITYRGDQVALYRNGQEYAAYQIGQPQAFGDNAMVLLGLRYIGGSEIGYFSGAIEEARIYDQALSAEQIAVLKTNQPSDPKPLAWWTFEDGKADDLMRTFPARRLEGSARVADGKLVLDGSSYLWAARDEKLLGAGFDDGLPTALFYKARSKETGNMWDSWLYFHEGNYYLYYLANSKGGIGKWDNISMATSPDGVHWKEIGRVLARSEGVTWMGSGSVYKSPNFDQDGKFFMNFSEWKGPRQTIFFAESKDLVHWTRLGNEYEFVQDERWYERNGRWDCIWTIPRPGGGLYGYWSATPKAETGGVFGFGETMDGITWKALPPPKTPGVEVAEVGAIERIGEKYYMIYRGSELILMADRPEGPFVPDRNSYPIMLHYFSRFFPTPDGVLFNHHIFDRAFRQVFFAPLKSTMLDADGTLRLVWWKGNEKLKDKAIAVKPPALGDGQRSDLVMIEPAFDLRPGLVLEGTLKLPATKDAQPVGLFIALPDGNGEAVLVQAEGVTEFGSMRADGTGFKISPPGPLDVFGSGEKVRVRGYRDWSFGATARFRLLLKGSLMEFYLDDLLMQVYTLPQDATGHIGLLHGGDPAAITALKAWQAGELQPAAKGEDAWMQRPQDDVYSRAAPGTYNVPPELKNFQILSSTPLQISNAEEAGYDSRKWQGDSSRIIYHGGKYHVWMIDGYLLNQEIERRGRPTNGLSWIRYLTSDDGKTWQSVGFVPLGPKGSAYDVAIEQANVLMHEGRFYLFSEGFTANREKYKSMHAGIVCLTADAPEGPWKQVGDVMLRPAHDGRSFDSEAVVNPRHVFFQGKWFMYYKGHSAKAGEPTRNGVAIADSLTGPYQRYENNPLLLGHGHFAWRYKHGIIMMNFSWDRKIDTWILWTEDGLHFVPLHKGEGLFVFGSLYVPYDPLFGKPVTEQPTTEYWGLQNILPAFNVERIEWSFGSDHTPEKEKIQ